MRFDVNQYMHRSDAGTARIEFMSLFDEEPAQSDPPLGVELLSIYDIEEHPDNKEIYSRDGIEELANSIEALGLMHNLVVTWHRKAQKYQLISGHRRYMALRKLVEERGQTHYEKVPCLITSNNDWYIPKIRLIAANAQARQLTDAEKVKQYEELKSQLDRYEAKATFTEAPKSRQRDLLQAILKETSGQLARYNAISKNLTEPLREAFDEGKIGISAAYEASRVSEEGQAQLATKLREEKPLSIADVKEVYQKEKPKKAEEESEQTPQAEPISEAVQEADAERAAQLARVKAIEATDTEPMPDAGHDLEEQIEIMELVASRIQSIVSGLHFQEKGYTNMQYPRLDNTELEKRKRVYREAADYIERMFVPIAEKELELIQKAEKEKERR